MFLHRRTVCSLGIPRLCKQSGEWGFVWLNLLQSRRLIEKISEFNELNKKWEVYHKDYFHVLKSWKSFWIMKRKFILALPCEGTDWSFSIKRKVYKKSVGLESPWAITLTYKTAKKYKFCQEYGLNYWLTGKSFHRNMCRNGKTYAREIIFQPNSKYVQITNVKNCFFLYVQLEESLCAYGQATSFLPEKWWDYLIFNSSWIYK